MFEAYNGMVLTLFDSHLHSCRPTIRHTVYCQGYNELDQRCYAKEFELELLNDFCYSDSWMSHNGNCERDVKVCVGKAVAVCGKMKKIWNNKSIS